MSSVEGMGFGIGVTVWKSELTLFIKCRLLTTFTNSLDPDQARKKSGAWFGARLLDNLMAFLKEYFEKK